MKAMHDGKLVKRGKELMPNTYSRSPPYYIESGLSATNQRAPGPSEGYDSPKGNLVYMNIAGLSEGSDSQCLESKFDNGWSSSPAVNGSSSEDQGGTKSAGPDEFDEEGWVPQVGDSGQLRTPLIMSQDGCLDLDYPDFGFDIQRDPVNTELDELEASDDQIKIKQKMTASLAELYAEWRRINRQIHDLEQLNLKMKSEKQEVGKDIESLEGRLWEAGLMGALNLRSREGDCPDVVRNGFL